MLEWIDSVVQKIGPCVACELGGRILPQEIWEVSHDKWKGFFYHKHPVIHKCCICLKQKMKFVVFAFTLGNIFGWSYWNGSPACSLKLTTIQAHPLCEEVSNILSIWIYHSKPRYIYCTEFHYWLFPWFIECLEKRKKAYRERITHFQSITL